MQCAEGIGMSRNDDRFRVRPGAPKAKQPDRLPRFVNRVLRAASKSGAKRSTRPGARSAAKFGRGHVAASMAGRRLGANARRVVIKTRLVVLRQAGARSVETHLRYIEREGVGRDGQNGKAYGPATDEADLSSFEERGRTDRHQFRFIVAPEDAEQLDDLRGYTRNLMVRMEADLGTRLEWVAVDHWDTDNPHTHIVLRGRDETGRDLVIARDYISNGMRHRASELATEWLGPRTELEIRESLAREVEQERWTGVDRALQREVRDGIVRLNRLPENTYARKHWTLMLGRLQRLERIGLASQSSIGAWVAVRGCRTCAARHGRTRRHPAHDAAGDGRHTAGVCSVRAEQRGAASHRRNRRQGVGGRTARPRLSGLGWGRWTGALRGA